MADTYVVTAKSGLHVRKGKGTNYEAVGTKAYNTEVKVYSKADGWGKISDSAEKWCSMTYLKKVSSGKTAKKSKESSAAEDIISTHVDNLDSAKGTATYTAKLDEHDPNNIYAGDAKASTAVYKALMERYIRALGSPPRFTKEVDPYYNNDLIGTYTGRAMSMTWFSSPTIFSICPGTVDYLPGFSSRDKDKFFRKVKSMSDDTLKNLLNSAGNKEDKLNGKLYEFKSAYVDYINTVNIMARTAALYLGIGHLKMPGTKIKFSDFDYGYFSTPSGAKAGKGHSIFNETKRALNTAVSDDAYIHFFLTHQGSAVSENITTSMTASELENAFNDSGLSSAARNLEFLLGGAIGSSSGAMSDMDTLIAKSTSNSEMLGSFASLAKNYLKGGRLIFPQMIDSVGYDKSVSCTIKFISPYGDKRSIFLRTIVPAIHLIAMSTPKQVSENMYSYPYLCRVFQKGWFNTDLAAISNLKLTRGGAEDLSWTVDGISTEIEASFDITPLYSNLMVSNAKHPFLYLQNTSMMEYLSVMCGVDMKANNFDAKVKMAKAAITNKFTDIPANLARGIVDSKVINKVSGMAKFIN